VAGSVGVLALQGAFREHVRALADVGLDAVADAHGRWKLVDEQRLGVDRLEVYERVRAD